MEDQMMIFNLSEPLEYSKNGEFEKTLSLEIKPPAPNYHKLANALAQKVWQATLDAQAKTSIMASAGDEPDGETPDINADAVKMLLYTSSTPFDEYTQAFVNLLERTCTLDGETRITAALFDKIPIADKNNMMFEYIANFTVPLVF